MQPVTEAIGKKKPPHHHLGLGILPPDAAHIKTAGLFIMYIGHGSKVMRAGEQSIATQVKFRK
jgi:hypothetical protein